MGLKDKLNSLHRKVFDSNRAGTNAVHPVTILSELKARVEAGKKIFRQHTMVPDRYTVSLANQDLADLKPLMTVMVAELREELAAFIAAKGYRTIRPDIEVRFAADDQIDPGRISTTARFGSADEPRVAVKSNDASQRPIKAERGVRLVFQVDGRPDEEKSLPPGSHVIGRGNDADIVLPVPDPLVSKQHCRLEIDADSCRVIDLNSANGTCLNGRRITQSETLRDRDELGIGNTLIKVEICANAC